MAKPGLYANINAKRKRIEAGSGAPSEQNFKDAAKTAKKSHGGVHGGQKKLDKNKDGKISGADFKMMKNGGEFLAGNSNRRRSRNGG